MTIDLRRSEQELEAARNICQRHGTDLDSFLTLIVQNLISQSAGVPYEF